MGEGEGEEQWEEEGSRLAGGWAAARVYRARGCAELGRHVHHDDSKQHGRSLDPLLAGVLDARGVGPPGEGEG